MSSVALSPSHRTTSRKWSVALVGRSKVALIVLAYSGLLSWIYINFLTFYSYMGFTYDPRFSWYVGVSPILLIASSCALPAVIERVSHSILWLVFWLLYGPIVLLVPLQQIDIASKAWFLLALIASFHLSVAVSNIRLKLPGFCGVNERVGQVVFWTIYSLLLIFVLTVFGRHMQFVSFADVYTLRADNGNLLHGGLVGYALALLAWAFNPYLIAIGLVERRRFVLSAGVGGQLLLYTTLGQKAVLLSTLVIICHYLFYARRRVMKSLTLGWLMLLLAVIPLVPYLYGVTDDLSGAISPLTQLVTLVYMRTLGMVAAATGTYLKFFGDHPFTYYSHINVVSLLVHYPYKLSLGEVIGFDLVGDDLDANANFYATDGIAALGAVGVVIAGGLFGLVLCVADALTRNRVKLACTAMITFVMNLANSSLFTSLITGGGVMLLCLLYANGQKVSCETQGRLQ